MATNFDAELVALMRGAQAGNKDAYHQLLRKLTPRLAAYAKRRVDDGSVDDVVQAVLLRIHVARHSYDPSFPFEPWLFTIARNVVATTMKELGKRRAFIASDTEVTEGAGEAANAEAKIAVEAAFAQLPESQRHVIHLAKMQGLSMQEAAAVAGTSVATFKVRLHRAYTAFKLALAGDDDEAAEAGDVSAEFSARQGDDAA